MIYLCTALFFEASPFIKNFHLKHNPNYTRFSVYNNDTIYVLITGTGINAAIGLTYLLSNITIHPEDIFINVGVCGCTNKNIPIGSSFLINKIKDHTTNMTYYPEMLYRHNFLESSLESCLSVMSSSQIHTLFEPLIDMEASFIYQTATHFMKPHQLFLYKIVSDHLEDKKIPRDEIEKLITPHIHSLIEWAETISSTILIYNNIFTSEEVQLYDEIVLNLRLSVTLQSKLKQLLMYAKSCQKPVNAIMQDFLKNNDITNLKLKTEGKRYFELLQSKLI